MFSLFLKVPLDSVDSLSSRDRSISSRTIHLKCIYMISMATSRNIWTNFGWHFYNLSLRDMVLSICTLSGIEDICCSRDANGKYVVCVFIRYGDYKGQKSSVIYLLNHTAKISQTNISFRFLIGI
jgi:hypothetical protein